jgi:hypothetical protein
LDRREKLETSVADIIAGVRKAVEEAATKGSPVAGQDAEEWNKIARIAILRWRSAPRRRADQTRERRIQDLAAGFIEAFERDGRLVGPLKRDHLHLAECIATAVAVQEAGG